MPPPPEGVLDLVGADFCGVGADSVTGIVETEPVVGVVELGRLETVVVVLLDALLGFGAGRRTGGGTAAGRLETAAGWPVETVARASVRAEVIDEVGLEAWPMTSASRKTPANSPVPPM